MWDVVEEEVAKEQFRQRYDGQKTQNEGRHLVPAQTLWGEAKWSANQHHLGQEGPNLRSFGGLQNCPSIASAAFCQGHSMWFVQSLGWWPQDLVASNIVNVSLKHHVPHFDIAIEVASTMSIHEWTKPCTSCRCHQRHDTFSGLPKKIALKPSRSESGLNHSWHEIHDFHYIDVIQVISWMIRPGRKRKFHPFSLFNWGSNPLSFDFMIWRCP